ncbi:uncharacterized protein A4U43_C09F16790 [Asparagus officinalis]|uniref:RRM domain-containing protein n=1 Tax=Asparagus officinalis TaxID=4686 RepID=A0A5P1E7Z0_ASPOF|nr:uncharacterized protein A4U43_C09F16790 [Asparagus officinalis]
MQQENKVTAGVQIVDPVVDVFNGQEVEMPLKATERDVYEFFSKAGKVRDVRLIMDRNSRRSIKRSWDMKYEQEQQQHQQ